MAFNPLFIERLKPTEKTTEYFDPDPDSHGLAIRVAAPSGRKVWTMHYTFARKRCRMDLGRYPAVGLAEARQRAHAARMVLEEQPPRDPRKAAKADAGKVKTVSDVFALYIADLKRAPPDSRLRTIPVIERILRNHVEKFIGDLPAKELDRPTLKAVVDRVRDRGKHTMANRVFVLLKTALDWVVANEKELDSNPMALMTAPAKAAKGEKIRPLDDVEIAAFWYGVRNVFEPYCAATYERVLKLCLLTGCRISEAAEIKPGEIVGDVWTVPGLRTKNRKPHAIPLTADALAIIGNNPDDPWGLINGKPVRGERISDVFSGLDASKKLGSAKGYTVHSLRRTVATCMEELEIEESTISLCLNHTVASKPKEQEAPARATTVYIQKKPDRVMQRKRAAFEAWAAHLREIILAAA